MDVVDTVHSGHNTQWTQYAVCSGCSRIVVYGGGDIVHCVLCPLHPLV